MRQIILPEQYRVLETEDGNPIQPQTAFRLKYHMRRQGIPESPESSETEKISGNKPVSVQMTSPPFHPKSQKKHEHGNEQPCRCIGV